MLAETIFSQTLLAYQQLRITRVLLPLEPGEFTKKIN